MKSFITEDSFWELFPQAAVGVVIVEGMKPTAQIPQEDVDAMRRCSTAPISMRSVI